MNHTFTVAAILASGIHWGGSTEFDKAAVFLNTNLLRSGPHGASGSAAV